MTDKSPLKNSGNENVSLNYLNTRQHYNRVILTIIDTLVSVYPDWRFQQILSNIGIASKEDLFYEESKKTLEMLLQNDIVKKHFKNMKAINFNEFKDSY